MKTKIKSLFLAVALASISTSSFAARVVEGEPYCKSSNGDIFVKVKGESTDTWGNTLHVAIVDPNQGWLWDISKPLNSVFTTHIAEKATFPSTARMMVWDSDDSLRIWYDCI